MTRAMNPLQPEQRLELAGYLALISVMAFLGGFFIGKGHWPEVAGAIAVLALVAAGVHFTTSG